MFIAMILVYIWTTPGVRRSVTMAAVALPTARCWGGNRAGRPPRMPRRHDDDKYNELNVKSVHIELNSLTMSSTKVTNGKNEGLSGVNGQVVEWDKSVLHDFWIIFVSKIFISVIISEWRQQIYRVTSL